MKFNYCNGDFEDLRLFMIGIFKYWKMFRAFSYSSNSYVLITVDMRSDFKVSLQIKYAFTLIDLSILIWLHTEIL